jgi:hypothetical protein
MTELLNDPEVIRAFQAYREAIDNAPAGHCFPDQNLEEFLSKLGTEAGGMSRKQVAIGVLAAWKYSIENPVNWKELFGESQEGQVQGVIVPILDWQALIPPAS